MAIDKYFIEGGKIAVYNHYQLRLRELESKQPGVMLSVAKFSSSEAISQIPRYEIEFTCTQKDLPAQWVVNYPALFLMYPDGKPYESVKPRIVPGLITSFRQCSTTADETRYVVVLEHRMALLEQGRNNAVWQNDSIISLTEKVLNHHQFDRLDFRFSLEDPYPQHEFMLQYGESDGQHIARRLADGGVSFYFEYDEENDSDVIVFADHSYAWKRGLAIPFRHPAGMFDGGMESVWDMSVSRQVIPKSMLLNDENYRQAQQDMGSMAENNPDYPALYGEDYRWGEHYPQRGKEYALAPGEGLWYAKRRQERWLTEQVTFVGKSTCMDLRPGMVITTPGKVWPDAPDGLLIVSTHCERASRDIAYWVTFTAIPWNQDHTYRPAEQPWPQVPGTLSARISSTVEKDTYAHLDPQGRYRIRFDLDLAEWKKGFESCWVRLAKPYGGDGYGFHWPLLAGTGVAIQFTDGNLDRPYIAHVLHDSRHPDHVNIENNKRNVLRTAGLNKLRMEDERGKEHVKLSTVHSGKSQLNLGHLVDAARKQRGAGAELRTDAYVAVRGGQGVFITADSQQQAQGQQLDMQQAKALLTSALADMQSLAASAQRAQAMAADISRQQILLQQKIDKFQQAILLGSAPQGVALVSGEDMQFSAAQNLTLTAGKQIDVGAQKNFTLAAGKQISLYSREGAKFFSSQGDIDLQAQGGNVTSWSTQDTHISSGKKLVVTAQDELTLICGGGYIKLKAGDIEIGGPGNLLIKNAGLKKTGTASLQGVMKSFTPESFDEKFIVNNALTGHPISNLPYRISMPNGKIIEGVTSDSGETALAQSEVVDDMVLSFLPVGRN
jgi:type VI secretion system secreted protein VgrG